VRELLIANPVETVASKIGRSVSSVRQLCGRLGIRVKELRCDLFSVNSLAAAMYVRKAEIRYWIEQGGWRQCGGIRGEALATTSHQKLSP
jgi:hypothetical protein